MIKWNEFGTDVVSANSAVDALELAGLNWEVGESDLMLPNGDIIPDRKAIIRNDLGECAEAYLGTVGKNYGIIQNSEAFDFIDPIIKAGQAGFLRAGALRGGSRIFLELKIPEPMKVNGDQLEKRFYLQTAHDGSKAIEAKAATYRVICSNGMAVIVPNTVSRIKMRHSKNIKFRLQQAKDVISMLGKYFETAEQCFQRLLSMPMNLERMEQFTTRLIPEKETTDDKIDDFNRLVTNHHQPQEKLSTRKANIREDINRLFYRGVGNNGSNAYDAFNAVTEYVSHHRSIHVRDGRDEAEVRYEAVTSGSGEKLRQSAFEMLLNN